MACRLDWKVLVAAVGAVLLVGAAGCGDDETPGPTDGGGPDGMVDGALEDGSSLDDGSSPEDGSSPDDGGAIADGDMPTCVGIGEPCESTIECCGGRLCEADATGAKTCIDETFCQPSGATCETASECCSLSCDGTCQTDGTLCKPEGTECGADTECCSNDCNGTCQTVGSGCAPIGETCDEEGVDADCCSKNCANLGTEEEPDLRCIRASSCGARGEICTQDADCCSGVCLDGRCPTQDEIGGSRFAGEPCSDDRDCASFACASNYPGGPQVCQFLGGCRPVGEICTEDWQCCSDVNLEDGAGGEFCTLEMEGDGCVDHSVEGLATCGDQTAQTGPKEVGEVCKDQSGEKVHECCSGDSTTDGGISTDAGASLPGCEQTITGVWRCAGPGGFDECLEDGESCRAADQCCSNVCSPFEVETDGGTVTELRCGQCVEDGGLCTTDADCCNFTCTDGVCESVDDPVCVPLGGSCTATSECCDSDAGCFDDTCQILG